MAAVNRKELMSLAWAWARQEHWSRRMPAGTLRGLFPDALRRAWADLKRYAERDALAAKAVCARTVESLRAELIALENTDTLGWEGIERLSAVRTALLEAENREAMASKRDLITSAQGQFCSVTFTKANGERRTMRVQPAKLKFHAKGQSASDAARRAVETRAQRHPNLLPVWDADKATVRSVNLATVSRIKVGGTEHRFSA